MKIGKAVLSIGGRLVAPLFHRIGTAVGGTLLGAGFSGDEVHTVMGALALIVGVCADVMIRKINEGN